MKIEQFITLIVLILVWIGSTHYVISRQTDNIVWKILAIEYDKVGWMENYVKINKIQKEQIIAWLKQYEAQNWQVKIPNAQSKAPSNIWSKISKETITKIKDWAYILWNPDAEISFVEYSDLECPYCKKLHESWAIDEVIKTYNWKVNFIFKQFPLGFHKQAPMEAEAALCAWKLGGSEKYYEFINETFKNSKTNGRSYTKQSIAKLWLGIGLDEDKLLSCINSGQFKERASAETAEWQRLFGINWTPWNVLINNKTGKWDKLSWAHPAASFIQKIDSLLK
jgi:protein-disulfide isomerase